MEARVVAKFLQESVKNLRMRKGMPETKLWQPLYDRALKRCVEACDNNLPTIVQVIRHGFRQTVSQVTYDPSNTTTSARNQILTGWLQYRPNLWNMFCDHSYFAIAVFICDNRTYITYTLTDSTTHPSMRHVINPSSILRPSLFAPEDIRGGLFSDENLLLISSSAHMHLNIGLLPLGCRLKYDGYLQRLAAYYSREKWEFGMMDDGNCQMARTVFEVDTRDVRFEKIGEVIARGILSRLTVEEGCLICYGGIGVQVAGPGTLSVGVVCYGRAFHKNR